MSFAPDEQSTISYSSRWSNGGGINRPFDVLVASTLIVLLLPVFVLVALAIKFDDKGPVLYKQARVGRHFRLFQIYKFRSMLIGAEAKGLLTGPDDSRQTRVGRFLRRYKLDELPQLLNVLKGDMQLVGPRPEVVRYVSAFQSQYVEILQERPGLTDPASLAFRDEQQFFGSDAVEQQYLEQILPSKLKISLEYQKRRSPWTDFAVLVRTFFAAIS